MTKLQDVPLYIRKWLSNVPVVNFNALGQTLK